MAISRFRRARRKTRWTGSGSWDHAPDRPYDPLRVFRWRNYRDYGTGVAGDLFVHLFSSLHFVVSSRGPTRIQAAGGTALLEGRARGARRPARRLRLPRDRHAPRIQPVAAGQLRGRDFGKHLPAPGGERGGDGRDVDRGGASGRTWRSTPWTPSRRRRWPRRRRTRGDCPRGCGCCPRPRRATEVENGYRGAHVDHFFNFFRAIRGGPPVLEDAAFGLRAAAPALACNLSYFEDRIVRWDPDDDEAGLMDVHYTHTPYTTDSSRARRGFLTRPAQATRGESTPSSSSWPSPAPTRATPHPARLPLGQTPAPNTLTEAERAAGWRLLFDGQTTHRLARLQPGSVPRHRLGRGRRRAGRGRDRHRPGRPHRRRHRHQRILHRLRPPVRIQAVGGRRTAASSTG